MIKSITISSNTNLDTLKLELTNPEKSGFAITNIDGLGPGTSNIICTDITSADGSIYTNARINKRNIVLYLTMYAEPEKIEQLRLRLYKIFVLKRNINLQIETDSRLVNTSGYVEKVEPVIFSKQETVQISIICPDPFFYDGTKKGTHTIPFTFVGGGFAFANIEMPTEDDIGIEFANPVDESTLSMGEMLHYVSRAITYEGEVDYVGTKAVITFSASGTKFKIQNTRTEEAMTINSAKMQEMVGTSNFRRGDVLTINCIGNTRKITLKRGNNSYSLLNCISVDSDWIHLVPGENYISYEFTGDSAYIDLDLTYNVTYLGV